MPTLLLSRRDVRKLLNMKAVIDAVERAFRDWTSGKAQMPPKAYVMLERGDFRAMPAAVPGAVGVKWVSVYPQNPSLGLPTVMATIIHNDPETGYPLAIMDGTDITAYRTGATAAVASRYLARRGSRTLGIVGAGRQAQTQLLAHAELFDLKQVKVYDIDRASADRFVSMFPQFQVEVRSLPDTLNSDIVCTVTPARQPVVKKEWVSPGTHVNAVGADAEGKEELEPDVLTGSVVVVDDLRQASLAGEINVPISKGLYRPEDVHANLGEVIAGLKAGRTDDSAVTIFDATGVAIEDVAVARQVYEAARQRGGYLTLDLVGE